MSRETLSAFQKDGAVVIRSFFDDTTISELTTALKEYERDTVPRLPGVFYSREADSEAMRGLFWMNIFSPYFSDILADRRMLEVIERLTGWTPRPMFVEAFMKPAWRGGSIPLHQDVAYSAVDPPQQATIWVPIDRVRKTNGAVRYFLGSHKAGLKPHRASGIRGSSLEAENTETYPEAVFELNPGDVIVHDGLVLHDSPANETAQARRAIAFGYRGVSTTFADLVI
ncbi:phytanoyl-CoA dioxygenase family protein [Bradyrhizobium sp. SZCCHNR1051]|uniref:phytanoyl-CoA dioxygenase family protein n=1 Tax=Bradyrhizobium sp. SZCCHNR1051 TaxID=3057355 RepID=UPI0029165E2D|nr:phytanoyl-CoA dioxygenase family protein [Bradyrhizobium sp. SZCCHNR1051]